MKIVVFESEEWEKPFFEKLQKDHEIIFESEPLDQNTAKKYTDAEIISIFVFSDAKKETLKLFQNLKCIATRSTGFDHIDLTYSQDKNIQVCNVPSYGENTVAEHVFALLLAISHKIPEAVERTREGDFSQKGLQGFDLKGRTIGVIGTGHIGRQVIKIAKGFGMHILAHDIKPDSIFANEEGFKYVELDTLLSSSDVISLHVPENEATHHLIDEAAFAKIKPGCVLINTARGSIVDVKALLRALENKTIAAAGLDVLPEEPIIREEAELLRSFFTKAHDLEVLLADHILLHMENVIVTPHTAFNTKEAVNRILKTTLLNIENCCRGKPSNLVTKS